ncbi:cation:proton antiporter [Sphingomonas sp. 3-13AW]|uniref:cation:proton antiporter n=1 Tax=Sphingomonas sp. 3-13AW TaxID=3050450 RepID=UPI003BB5294A
MLEIALFTVAIAATSLLLQHRWGVPTPITIILSVIGLSTLGHQRLSMTDQDFDSLTYLMLPILICSDALALRWDEIRRNALSLGYVAGIMILLSVGTAILLNRVMLPDYHLEPAAVSALFCMVLATDPVTVSSVFGRFRLPHNLKVLAEGESLFNDATALIAFSVSLTLMGYGGARAAGDPVTYSLQMVAGALVVGLVIGWVGLQALRWVHDAMTETMLVLAMALGSFAAAEHLHSSGILAVIVSIMFANSVITRRLRDTEKEMNEPGNRGAASAIRNFIAGFDSLVKDAAAYRVVRGNIQFAAILAATVLFISMANMVRLEILYRYWREIAAVFIGATYIRMAMLGIFARLSRWTDKVVTIPLHWWKVLAAAGVKGAFSILMLHMISKQFPYHEMFEAVVIGNILLSTFLYPLALVTIIRVHKRRFDAEYAADHLRFEE